ncbi:MAG: hypothetical protein PHY34_02005 [Patescibacteria group bacterium]|nr:hypothetical protein [Patescibacteria group bacterium]MDD5715292.1 hypothetical protein [Patescibacteria group bacterium]
MNSYRGFSKWVICIVALFIIIANPMPANAGIEKVPKKAAKVVFWPLKTVGKAIGKAVTHCVNEGRALEEAENRNRDDVSRLWNIFLTDANKVNIGFSITCDGAQLIALVQYNGPYSGNEKLTIPQISFDNGKHWSGKYFHKDKKRNAWTLKLGKASSMKRGSSSFKIRMRIYDPDIEFVDGKEQKGDPHWGPWVESSDFSLSWR